MGDRVDKLFINLLNNFFFAVYSLRDQMSSQVDLEWQ